MASRNVPAVRTCSQVRVVRLACGILAESQQIEEILVGCLKTLTAKRSNRSVDRLDEDTLPMDLRCCI